MATFGTYFSKSVRGFDNATVATTYKSYDRNPKLSEYVSCNLGKAEKFSEAALRMQLLA
jgi:hypothetical protein